MDDRAVWDKYGFSFASEVRWREVGVSDPSLASRLRDAGILPSEIVRITAAARIASPLLRQRLHSVEGQVISLLRSLARYADEHEARFGTI